MAIGGMARAPSTPSTPRRGAREAEKKKSPIDRGLTCFAPWGRLLLISVPYYGIGAIFYTNVETKACESVLAMQDPNYDEATCLEHWTITDGLYFTTVSMSTVGYGDLTCSTLGSRIFTTIWILLGMFGVFPQIAIAFRNVIGGLMRLTWKVIDFALGSDLERKSGRTRSEPDGTLEGVIWYYFKGLSVPFIWFIFMQGVIGSTIAWFDAHLVSEDGWGDLFITMTTVGYGDLNVTSQLGRLLATGHILITVIWIGAIIGHVGNLQQQRERQLRHAEMMKRSLDQSILEEMDRDGNGVDQVEFVAQTLMHLGAELGGEPLDWNDHIAPILTQFRSFDVDGDGILTHKDLTRLSDLRNSVLNAGLKRQAGRGFRATVRANLMANKFKAIAAAAAPPASVERKAWSDGTEYEGGWRDGKPHGQGITSWADGSRYNGGHVAGRPHGGGRLTFPNGDAYIGQFERGQRHGRGSLVYANGTRWEGEWALGKRHGQGAIIKQDGSRDEGEWQNGERIMWARSQAMGDAFMAVRAQQAIKPGAAAAAAFRKSVRVMPIDGDEDGSPTGARAAAPSSKWEKLKQLGPGNVHNLSPRPKGLVGPDARVPI